MILATNAFVQTIRFVAILGAVALFFLAIWGLWSLVRHGPQVSRGHAWLAVTGLIAFILASVSDLVRDLHYPTTADCIGR